MQEHDTITTCARSRPRARRLASRRHRAARPRARNAADREGLCRPGRARRLHRDLRDEDRPAQRRQGRGEGLDRSGLTASWLFEDATAAIASLGFTGRQGEHMVALENTPDVHNMVVCTLCSCYPWTVLGLPPVWYKSPPYRSRAVIDPRGVLAEFGVTLPETTKIRVWDSTAEIRYLVVPMRPAGTEGLERGAARRSRHARFHDRHRPAARARRRARLTRRAGQVVSDTYWARRSKMYYYAYAGDLIRAFAADAESMIDVGSGNARYMEEFYWIGTRHALDKTKAYSSDCVTAITANFLTFEPERKYDFAVCMQVLEHVKPARRFAAKLFDGGGPRADLRAPAMARREGPGPRQRSGRPGKAAEMDGPRSELLGRGRRASAGGCEPKSPDRLLSSRRAKNSRSPRSARSSGRNRRRQSLPRPAVASPACFGFPRGGRNERPARSRRRARLRAGRAGAGRAALPRRMGAPRLRAVARHGRHRRVEPRHVAPCARAHPAGRISRLELLRDLAEGHGAPAGREGPRHAGRDWKPATAPAPAIALPRKPTADGVSATLAKGAPTERPSAAPALFKVGDRGARQAS